MTTYAYLAATVRGRYDHKATGCMAAKKSRQDINYKEEFAALQQHLQSGQCKPVYLVTGEQDYLRTQNRDIIRHALVDAADTMNSAYYSGDQFTITEIVDLADTMPFFADRRVITIEDSWLFARNAGDTDALTDYLERMPETTHIVFVQKDVDKTRRLYRKIKQLGYIIDCVTPDQHDLQIWVGKRFQKAGLAITTDAMRQLIDNLGDTPDMLQLQAEADKLIAYCMGRDAIRIEDVREIGSVQIKERIFDMIAAITARRTEEALTIYMELLQLQTPPQVILALMIRNYNQLLQIGELSARNVSDQEIASMLHLNPWALRSKIKPSLKGQTAKALIASLDACLQSDMDYKAGRVSDQLAVEQLIITCCETGAPVR